MCTESNNNTSTLKREPSHDVYVLFKVLQLFITTKWNQMLSNPVVLINSFPRNSQNTPNLSQMINY